MAIVIAADVIIRGERGTFPLKEWVASNRNEELQLAAITLAELWQGVERATAQHKARREEYLRAVIESMDILPYTETTSYEHARVWAELESTGSMASPYDLIVAATALENGSSLATFNKRHFAGVTGLNVIEPK